MIEKYTAVIGLEVHAQLLTESKAFSVSSAHYGEMPNSNTDPVTLGMPGTLPVLNKMLVESAVKMGLATNCKIRQKCGFARKNYFYPDMPKGYQISQHEDPICFDGRVEIELEGKRKYIGLTRIHMEEDSGKSIHDLDVDTLLDFNRAGTPLIEIVSEPEIRSSDEAYQYLTQIKQVLLYLGISTGNMEEGALRCDANISVMPKGSHKFGTRTEVKNLNSFRNVQKAIEYEIKRQVEVNESGGKVIQQTMMWDGGTGTTRAMRSKGDAADYRYFPEPDLPPLRLSDEYINKIKGGLPELPLEKKYRFISEYKLPSYDAGILVEDRELADLFERSCGMLETRNEKNYKLVSNWLMRDLLQLKAEKDVKISELDLPDFLVPELVDLISRGDISSSVAKEIFPECYENKKHPSDVVEEKGLKQVSDEAMIEGLAKEIVEANPEQVEQFRAGKDRVLGFFVGQLMKKTKGKANPKLLTEAVKKYLDA
jgi:aspartyl-tRNA(Asn)/glutamyl-tRNA(Gln) amidotransferase subunit B